MQPAHEKIGVVDAQWIEHQTVPTLGNQVWSFIEIGLLMRVISSYGLNFCDNFCFNRVKPRMERHHGKG